MVELTHNINCQQGEEKSWDNFIKAEEGKLFPYQNCQTTGDNAGENAIACGPAPKQRGQKCRPESGTEASPGIGDNFQNKIIRIKTDENRNGGDYQYGNTADP